MKFVGIRKDEETQEIIKYELNLLHEEIQCLYKDQYGVYACTQQGRMYKIDSSLEELKFEVGL